MYIIVVYDAVPKRGVKLLKFLRQHLTWVQNSVFEGDVTDAGIAKIKAGVNAALTVFRFNRTNVELKWEHHLEALSRK